LLRVIHPPPFRAQTDCPRAAGPCQGDQAPSRQNASSRFVKPSSSPQQCPLLDRIKLPLAVAGPTHPSTPRLHTRIAGPHCGAAQSAMPDFPRQSGYIPRPPGVPGPEPPRATSFFSLVMDVVQDLTAGRCTPRRFCAVRKTQSDWIAL